MNEYECFFCEQKRKPDIDGLNVAYSFYCCDDCKVQLDIEQDEVLANMENQEQVRQ